MAAIYLIRHGQASFGQQNYDVLSERGIRQAQMTGAAFSQRGIQFDLALQGAMQRHAQTAEHCLTQMDYMPTLDIDPRFNEFPHEEILFKLKPELSEPHAVAALLAQSDNPNKTFQQLFARAIARWMSGEHDTEYSETWSAFRARVHQALQELVTSKHNNIAVFTSGGPISLAVQFALELPDATAINLSWSTINASITRLLHSEHRGVSLSYFNDFAHLERQDQDYVTYR